MCIWILIFSVQTSQHTYTTPQVYRLSLFAHTVPGMELARLPPALALRQLRALRSARPVLERGRRVGG